MVWPQQLHSFWNILGGTAAIAHPLLLQMGDDGLLLSGSGVEARMLDLDKSFQELAEVEGAKMYKAADWRCALA